MIRRRLAQILRSSRPGRFLLGAVRLVIDVFNSPFLGLLLAALFADRLRRPHKNHRISVAFYPRIPNHRYMIWKAIKYMGAQMALHADVKRDSPANVLYIMWLDETFIDPSVRDGLPVEARGATLNGRLLDISKRRVDAVFAEVFGYGLMVEPTKHQGQCVEKSNRNGRHDGRVIQCPVIKSDPEKIYQKLVDNSVEDEFVMDIRIPIIYGGIPFAYLKYRPLQARFSNTNSKVLIRNVEECLSSDEIGRIKQFCLRIGLDLGELDLVRDTDRGRLYIVDVNNTPYGPPNHLGLSGSLRAIRLYSNMFWTKCAMAKIGC